MAIIYARNRPLNDGFVQPTYGTADADQIYGTAGNDVLVGGAGNDYLMGGYGNDTLVGGSGADTMWGGRGLDRFYFGSVGDMVGDVIGDFSTSEDKIDARNVTHGEGLFIGMAGFSGSGEVEVRHFYVANRMGGATTVQFDLDGDGTADASLQLRSAYHLSAEDFLI